MRAIEQQGCSSPHRANVTFEAMAVSSGGSKTVNSMLARLPTDFPASATFFTPIPDRHPLASPDGTVSQATRVRFVRPLCDLSRTLRTMAVALGGW